MILANQYRILGNMYPDEQEHCEKVREILESGYTLNYSWIADHVHDEVMTEDECLFVMDVLDMHGAMQHAWDALDPSNRASIPERAVIFSGFDGNNEARFLVYAEIPTRSRGQVYLCEGRQGWIE